MILLGNVFAWVTVLLAAIGGGHLDMEEMKSVVESNTFPTGYYKYGKMCARIHLRYVDKKKAEVFAAQIEQESAWKPDAKSPFAEGLTQFTASTKLAVEKKYGIQTENITNPRHACILQSLLMVELLQVSERRLEGFHSSMAGALRLYNGGPLFWCEWRKAGRPTDAFAVEPFSCRARWAHKENTEYPRIILCKRLEKYKGVLGVEV